MPDDDPAALARRYLDAKAAFDEAKAEQESARQAVLEYAHRTGNYHLGRLEVRRGTRKSCDWRRALKDGVPLGPYIEEVPLEKLYPARSRALPVV